MDSPRVVIVMLRQPRRNDPNEMRTDPLWEFGSFGCTGCHRRNLMNPKKLTEHNGAQFAFAQNGELGIKLVHVTPPIRMLRHSSFGEAKWDPADMPLRYANAPTLVDKCGRTDVPALMHLICNVRRRSPVAKFASKFRSRRRPLPSHVGQDLIAVYSRFRANGAAVAESYHDALPYLPCRIDGDREATYQRLIGF